MMNIFSMSASQFVCLLWISPKEKHIGGLSTEASPTLQTPYDHLRNYCPSKDGGDRLTSLEVIT